jgi:hypothetical protein
MPCEFGYKGLTRFLDQFSLLSFKIKLLNTVKLPILSSLLIVSLASAAPIRYHGTTWPEKLNNWKSWYENGTLKGWGKTPRDAYLSNLRWAREKLRSQNKLDGYKAQIDSAFAQIHNEDVK